MRYVSGKTYLVRRELRALGGQWDSRKGAWAVPEERFLEAKGLLEVGLARRNVRRRANRTARRAA